MQIHFEKDGADYGVSLYSPAKEPEIKRAYPSPHLTQRLSGYMCPLAMYLSDGDAFVGGGAVLQG